MMLAFLFTPFLVGALTAVLAGWLLIPILRKLKAGQVISTDAPETHLKKAGTPTMGGAIILVGAVVAALLFQRGDGNLGAVLLCTLSFGAIGFVDDLLIVRRGKNLGLRAREKLAGQFLVAILFSAWWYHIDPNPTVLFTTVTSPMRIAVAVYHVFLLVGLSNAVNLTDGLDGLAAGVTLPSWIALGVLGLSLGRFQNGVTDLPVVGLCAAFAGASLGYLWYNAHPAQVFMGDTGSLAIGGGMAAAAIALRQEWVLLLVALIPIVEAGSVTIQVISFKTTGKRVFLMSPVHHHFEKAGWPETRVVARFVITSALCALLALAIVLR